MSPQEADVEKNHLVSDFSDKKTVVYHNSSSSPNHSHKGFLTHILLSGAERVKREKLEDRDFLLRQEDKIAEYDIQNLVNYWKSSVMKQSALSLMVQGTCNIIRRTLPMICAFLLIFYLFTIFMLLCVCTPKYYDSANSQKNGRNSNPDLNHKLSVKPDDKEFNAYCQAFIDKQESLILDERIFNGLITFFVGFYVSFIVRNWWQNMKIIPFLDSLCINLCSYLVLDSRLKEDSYKIQVNRKKVTIKQFKKDICRYVLLSWTMSFCRISCRLKRIFHSPKIFHQHGLLTVKEYKKLRTHQEDGWLERWATPLLWANKLICSVRKEESSGNNPMPSDIYPLIVKETTRVEITLLDIQNKLEQLNKEYYFSMPGLMHQVISTALYFFFWMGVIAGQNISIYTNDSTIEEHNTTSMIGRLALNFPFYYCAKYMLLIGWIKLAEDLQNPFGEDM